MLPGGAGTILIALVATAHTAPGFAAAPAFAPLEPCTAPSPAGPGAELRPEAIGAVLRGRRDGHLWAHAKGYVHAPLGSVWAALRDPGVSRLSSVQGQVVAEADAPAPIGFRVDYRVRVLVFDIRWQVAYRGGALAGSVDRLEDLGTTIGFRWEKSAGTPHIRVLSGSLVAREASPGVTALELVAWLDADRTGEPDAVRTLTGWFDRIVAHVHEHPPAPEGSAGP